MMETLAGVDWYNAVGLVGVGFYLGSYAALQFGFVRGTGYLYATLNTIAASLVAISLIGSFNLSSLIIQVSWIVIGLVGMTRIYIVRRRLRFSPEEKDLIDTALPLMPREQARELLNLGRWETMDIGVRLTREGEVVEELVYLAEGEASVVVQGNVVAHINRQSFIGEMSCLSAGVASACVQISRPALCFCVNAQVLRDHVRRKPDIGDQLEIAFSKDMRSKLKKLNETVAGGPGASGARVAA